MEGEKLSALGEDLEGLNHVLEKGYKIFLLTGFFAPTSRTV